LARRSGEFASRDGKPTKAHQQFAAADHYPTYLLLLWLVAKFGASRWLLRLPSAIFARFQNDRKRAEPLFRGSGNTGSVILDEKGRLVGRGSKR
jgi:hypothetical protein